MAQGSTRHWWVNHEAASGQEIEQGYLWAPRRSKNGSRNPTNDTITRVAPADTVFSCAEGKIGAVGLVVGRARPAPRPTHEDRSGEAGWLLPVRFESLVRPLILKDQLKALAPQLPKKNFPFRLNGDVNSSVYLAEVPVQLAEALRDLLDGQLQKVVDKLAIETDDRVADAAMEEQIWQRTDLSPREKSELVNARLGQGTFRENVERVESGCRVTGVLDRRHLRAHHIKPWRVSDDREKLDGCNGLLLSPHMGHLFDRGHLSFSNEGRPLISKHLNLAVTKSWGLEKLRAPHPLRAEQQAYLEFHRQNVFEKLARGRRS